jgi:hypothetical protein
MGMGKYHLEKAIQAFMRHASALTAEILQRQAAFIPS